MVVIVYAHLANIWSHCTSQQIKDHLRSILEHSQLSKYEHTQFSHNLQMRVNPAKGMSIQNSAPTAAANPLYLIYFSLLCSELGKWFASISVSPVKVNGCGHGCGSEIQYLSHAIWTFSISAHSLQFLIRFPSYYLTATISLHSFPLAPTTMG